MLSCRAALLRLFVVGILLFGGLSASAGSVRRAEARTPASGSEPAADYEPLKPALVTTDAGRTCQETVASAQRNFVESTLAAEQSCLLLFQRLRFLFPKNTDATALCRGAMTATERGLPSFPYTRWVVENAERKAAQSIAAGCTDPVVADLLLCGDDVGELTECTLRRSGQQVQAALDAEFGEAPPVFFVGGPARCQAGVASESRRYLARKLAAVNRCLDERNRSCLTGNAAELCVGALVDGTHVPPADRATAKALAQAEADLRKGIQRSSCSAHALQALDTCSTDPKRLADCLIDRHWRAAGGVVAAQYGGAERFADPASGIGPVVASAGPGETVLVDAGTYVEKFAVTEPDFTVIGQKTCEGDRPVIENPAPGYSENGIFACGSLVENCGGADYGVPSDQPGRADRLLFQSLEIRDFDANDIFVTGARGVTFRDLLTTGPGTPTGTEYGIFPVFSSDILVEDSIVTGVRDAGIYIGKSIDIVVRRNEVYGNVAGIEVENSANAEVYENHAYGNSGGLLVFKLPGPSFQASNCHVIRDNLVEENDLANFGSGIVGLVPPGTGMLVLSNDSTLFENNVVRGNDTFGLFVTDQKTIDLVFDAFGEFSEDQSTADNFFVGNLLEGNGENPADPLFGALGLAADAVSLVVEGNMGCQSGNAIGTVGGTFASLPACVLPPVLPGCPYPFPDPFPQP